MTTGWWHPSTHRECKVKASSSASASAEYWRALYAPQALQHCFQDALMLVPALLGIARCSNLRVVSRDWQLACMPDSFTPPSIVVKVLGPAISMSLRSYAEPAIQRLLGAWMPDVLGAPEFQRSAASVEDEVHWLLTHPATRKHARASIRSTFCMDSASILSTFASSVRSRCKLPGTAVDVVFQLRSGVRFTLEPLHCAVLLSSRALVQKLLSTLKSLDEDIDCQATVSPLFLAVLFAEQDVVDVLRRYGASLSDADAVAAIGLPTVFLWAVLEERLSSLHLEDEATRLRTKVHKLCQQAAQAVDANNPQVIQTQL